VTVVVNDKSTESGKIFVRHDDKMRIELTQPDPRTILRDGDDFYIYNPKIHRVEDTIWVRKIPGGPIPVAGLGTPGSELKKSYSITLQGEETLDNRKVVCWELLPEIGRRAKPTLENPVVDRRIHLASGAAEVF